MPLSSAPTPKNQKSFQTVKKWPGCQGNWFLKDLYMPIAGAQPWMAWDFKDDPILKDFQKSLSPADPKSHCPRSPGRGTRKMPLRRSILSHPSAPHIQAINPLSASTLCYQRASLPAPGEFSSSQGPRGDLPRPPKRPDFTRRLSS